MTKRVLLGGGLVIAIACAALVWSLVRVRQAAPLPSAELRVPASWHQVRESVGHLAHVDAAGLACRDCHAIDSAGFVPPREICAGCHQSVESALHPASLGHASVGCQDCHGFGPDSEVRPAQCMRCHERMQGLAAAVTVHGELACTTCHRAHETPALVPQGCPDCHSEQRTEHGRASARARVGVTGSGSGVAGEESATRTAGRCLDCHSMHAAEDAARERCLACHRNEEPRVAAGAVFPGHDTCVGCHQPHEFTRASVAACTSCHADQRTLGVAARSAVQQAKAGAGADNGGGGGHQRCANCHRGHDVRHPVLCTGCHAQQRSTHPAHAGSGPCLGCHPIHSQLGAGAGAGAGGQQIARACVACHRQATHAEATACADCHQAHGALRPEEIASPRLCLRCHADNARSSAATGHANCLGCHVQAGHAPAAPVPACAQCHDDIGARVASGHARCSDCHTSAAHAPSAAPQACASCHAAQRDSAPVGHRTCGQCHEPHAGTRRAEASCASCHEQQAQRGHGVHLACAECHRAHGPDGVAAPPACTKCHAPAGLPGVHRAHQSARCSDCHRSHERAPRKNRASCATCHRGLATHEPTTNTCTGCHVFRASAPASP